MEFSPSMVLSGALIGNGITALYFARRDGIPIAALLFTLAAVGVALHYTGAVL